eukprot:COSAG06_NODE_756_length_12531_cov_76.395592_5_plen_330_part_00
MTQEWQGGKIVRGDDGVFRASFDPGNLYSDWLSKWCDPSHYSHAGRYPYPPSYARQAAEAEAEETVQEANEDNEHSDDSDDSDDGATAAGSEEADGGDDDSAKPVDGSDSGEAAAAAEAAGEDTMEHDPKMQAAENGNNNDSEAGAGAGMLCDHQLKKVAFDATVTEVIVSNSIDIAETDALPEPEVKPEPAAAATALGRDAPGMECHHDHNGAQGASQPVDDGQGQEKQEEEGDMEHGCDRQEQQKGDTDAPLTSPSSLPVGPLQPLRSLLNRDNCPAAAAAAAAEDDVGSCSSTCPAANGAVDGSSKSGVDDGDERTSANANAAAPA